MKPLEEYMLFTKTGAENISVIHSQGVRSAQCSMEFDVLPKFVPEPSLNFTVVNCFFLFFLIILTHKNCNVFDQSGIR